MNSNALIAIIFACLCLYCSNTVSDTGSGTSAGNPVVTGVVEYNGVAAEGVFVFVEKADFLDTTTTKNSKLPDTTLADAKTDSLGCFTLDSLPSDSSCRVEFYSPAIYKGAIEDIDSEDIEIYTTIDLGKIKLSKLHTVSGSIECYGDTQPNHSINMHVYGLNRHVAFEEDSTYEIIVPKSAINIMFSSNDMDPKNSNDITVASDINISEKLLATTPVSDGYICDTLIIRKLLDINEMYNIPFDSITEVLSGRVSKIGLSGNGFSILYDGICGLTKLKEIEISGTLIASLPDSIGNLTSLTELEVDNNKLTTLPKSIINLTSLTEADLGYNYLTSLDSATKLWADTVDPDWKSKQK